MNAPHPLQQQQLMVSAAPQTVDAEDELNLIEYWDILVDNRWLVLTIVALFLAMGAAYALLARPVYQSNLLIQVEDSASSAKSFLGEAASLFDVKTPATAEMEILRSRMVLGAAVDSSLMYIEARPRYIPIIGSWLASRSNNLSDPGIFGLGGFVSGREKITIPNFNVPSELEGSKFRLTFDGDQRYTLTHPDLPQGLTGTIGTPMTWSTPGGQIALSISGIDAKPGAQFTVIRYSRLATVEGLQEDLRLAEKGRQSGVIEASLQSTDPRQLTLLLNEIGRQYVRQNVERKAAEAQKTLAFLDVQLPQFKKQLDQAEEAYSRYRNQKGTVSLDDEAKLILGRSVDLQGKLLEAQQRRVDLVARFTNEHPAVKTVDDQIDAWNREINALNQRVRGLPAVQQDALRLERDVKVNNELYQQLRNNALQLQLIREGKIGNVRLIDDAALPEVPVRPKKAFVMAVSLALGLLAGVLLALARSAFFSGVRDPQEVEHHTGLNVYSTIPLSPTQEELTMKVTRREPGLHVLSHLAPQDPATESFRSMRTALQFAMLDAPNNIVIVTGATPGVGKSFVAANLCAVLATGEKRVLLIDADLRKGYLNYYFGRQRAKGLSEVLSGQMDVSAAIHRQVLPNVDLITTGTLPPNPAELLSRGVLARVLETLSSQYDLVVLDTPPILVAADTLSVAPHAGTLLFVARADQTQIGEIQECSKRLAHTGRGITGVLFNALDFSRRHYGSYSYKYGRYKYRQYSYATPAQSA